MSKILSMICLVVLVSVAGAFDVTVTVGKAALNFRQQYVKKSYNVLLGDKKGGDRYKAVASIFKEKGGVALLDSVESFQMGIGLSGNRYGVARVWGKVSKDAEQQLKQAQWQSMGGAWAQGELILILEKDGFIASGSLSLDQLKLMKSQFTKKSEVSWVEALVDSSALQSMMSRNPMVYGMLSGIQHISLKWMGESADLSMVFEDPSKPMQLGMFVGQISSVLQGTVKAMTGYQRAYGFTSLDKDGFMQQTLITEWVLDTLGGMKSSINGNEFQLSFIIGEPSQFLEHVTPIAVVSQLLFPGGALSGTKSPVFIPGMVLGGQGGATPPINAGAGLRGNAVNPQLPEGPCPKERKMVEQALAFYRLDHGDTGDWTGVKSQLFEKEYLPSDLSCNGKSIKQNQIFKESSHGVVDYR
jgi:hypothetical protein